jgi:hypothetical protein
MNPLTKDRTELPQVKFPLAIGEKWDTRYDWLNGSYFGTISKGCKVAAFETVKVPAGKFEAFRIEVFGWNKDKSRVGSVNGDLKLTETYWYAPAVKRIIKYQGKQTKWIPPADTEVWSLVYELSAYQLAPPTP